MIHSLVSQYLNAHVRPELFNCLLPFCYRNNPTQAHPARSRLLRILFFLLGYILLGLLSLVNRASLNWVSTKPRPAHSDAIPFDPTMVFPDDMEVHAEASLNTSLAALIPDSTAPSIHACLSDVCSPAKWIRSWHFHTFSKSSFS